MFQVPRSNFGSSSPAFDASGELCCVLHLARSLQRAPNLFHPPGVECAAIGTRGGEFHFTGKCSLPMSVSYNRISALQGIPFGFKLSVVPGAGKTESHVVYIPVEICLIRHDEGPRPIACEQQYEDLEESVNIVFSMGQVFGIGVPYRRAGPGSFAGSILCPPRIVPGFLWRDRAE